ncbi:hypothetical protein [Flavobacterium pectinovorum]|uniref:hypothetical protein n=1 Tax=Flavobacterium pectinovorum TaxID=29533 RepID=UPI001FAD7159|nr:hypothetical protein [Flavobacterium pectinovorum]MCI9845623.1 hypothetical protein [Flavobacterium pectinovorum]
MKNLFKKQNTEMDFTNLSTIISTSAAAGMAIANHLGKNPQTGGLIGVGLSLLVTGLITALEDEVYIPNSKN